MPQRQDGGLTDEGTGGYGWGSRRDALVLFFNYLFFFITNYLITALATCLRQKKQLRDPNDGVTVIWALGMF